MPAEPRISETEDEGNGLVYFIGHGELGPVKVGFTADRDPSARLRQLQIGSPEPLTLLGTVSAYASIERVIQTFLRPHLVRGEWFERDPALLLLARLRDRSTHHRADFLEELAFLLIQQHPAKTTIEDEDADPPLSVRVAHALIFDWVEQLSRVNTEMALPFRAWLQAQIDRNDPIGDLATDATRDPRFPATGTLRDYLSYVIDRARESAVTRALIDAWIECDTTVSSLTVRPQDVCDWEKDA